MAQFAWIFSGKWADGKFHYLIDDQEVPFDEWNKKRLHEGKRILGCSDPEWV